MAPPILKPWILVCPASRGIGFALARSLLTNTSLPILALTRSPNKNQLKDLLLEGMQPMEVLQERLHVRTCDVTRDVSVWAAMKETAKLFPHRSHYLHAAFILPGYLRAEKNYTKIDPRWAHEMFQVNILGPMFMAKYFTPFLPRRTTRFDTSIVGPLPKQTVWLNMAARLGSTSDNRSGGWYSYRASKAALINYTKSLDIGLQVRSADKAMAIAYHPGTVMTELTRKFWDTVPPNQLFKTDYAVNLMTEFLSNLQVSQRGRCWDFKNEEVLP